MTPATPKDAAAPAEEPGAARVALLEAAQALFLENGFAATRVEDIATRAGFSKGTVYLYFPTKRDLFCAVVEAGIVERLAQAEALADNFSGSASELLATMLRNNLLEFWGSPSAGIPRLVIAESKQFPDIAAGFFANVTGRARQLLARVLQFGVEQGEYRDIDVEYTARCILNALDFELIAAHARGADVDTDFDPQRYIDTLLTLVATGVAATRKEADS